MEFKYYFNNLYFKDRLLSFLIIPLILFLIYWLYDKYILQNAQHNTKQQIRMYKKTIKKLSSTKSDFNEIKTIRYIEKIATKSHIKILNMKINNNSFTIKSIGRYKNIMQFIIKIENNMKIISLQIYTSIDKQIIIDGVFTIYTNKINNNNISIDNIPNPFQEKKSHINNHHLKLLAIFNQDVCINNTWYQCGAKIGKYTLEKVFKNHIELSINNKIIKLKIQHND